MMIFRKIADFITWLRTPPPEPPYSELRALEWLEPWETMLDSSDYGTRRARENELMREIHRKHKLFPYAGLATCIARKKDTDDYLFWISPDNPQFAVVHLTYSGRLEPWPDCPSTIFHESLEDFMTQMDADHDFFNEDVDWKNMDPQTHDPVTYAKAVGGDPFSQARIGVCYEKGLAGPQDYEKALEWYLKASAQGDAIAQRNLGVMYRDGCGVPQSTAIAYMWLHLAASPLGPGRHEQQAIKEHAAQLRDELKKKLPPNEFKEAKRLIQNHTND